MVCEHLQPLEAYLQARHIPETFRGKPWSDNCREWVYYNCMLETESLRSRLNLPPYVTTHSYFDPKAGSEAGFICTLCNDGIMGIHPYNPLSDDSPVIK